MARLNHTSRLAETEEALMILFCLIDDAYIRIRSQRYEVRAPHSRAFGPALCCSPSHEEHWQVGPHAHVRHLAVRHEARSLILAATSTHPFVAANSN